MLRSIKVPCSNLTRQLIMVNVSAIYETDTMPTKQ